MSKSHLEMGHNLVTNIRLLANINILKDEVGNNEIWKVEDIIPWPDVVRKTEEKSSKDKRGINMEYAVERFGIVSVIVSTRLFSFMAICLWPRHKYCGTMPHKEWILCMFISTFRSSFDFELFSERTCPYRVNLILTLNAINLSKRQEERQLSSRVEKRFS